jgi:NADH-quinone oxidoreductase subunit B
MGEEGTNSETSGGLRHLGEHSGGPMAAEVRRFEYQATRLEKALDWAAGLAPSPLRVATSCCGMSIMQGGDTTELLGSGPPAVSSRAADLLIVAGSITPRQATLLLEIYERMLEPRWVIAWGACAISGGAYDNYATISGLGRILPVDVVVPGCPPAPIALREALEMLRSGAARDSASISHGSPASSQGEEWPIQRPERFVDPSMEVAASKPGELRPRDRDSAE